MFQVHKDSFPPKHVQYFAVFVFYQQYSGNTFYEVCICLHSVVMQYKFNTLSLLVTN